MRLLPRFPLREAAIMQALLHCRYHLMSRRRSHFLLLSTPLAMRWGSACFTVSHE